MLIPSLSLTQCSSSQHFKSALCLKQPHQKLLEQQNPQRKRPSAQKYLSRMYRGNIKNLSLHIKKHQIFTHQNCMMCLPVATLTWTSIAEESILQADEDWVQHFKSSHDSGPRELQPWIAKRPHHSIVAEFGNSMALCIRELNACQTNFSVPTKSWYEFLIIASECALNSELDNEIPSPTTAPAVGPRL